MIGTRFVDNSPDFLKAAAKRKRQALDAAGLTVSGRAKEYTPVDTGRLRASLTWQRVTDNVAHIGTNVEYAIYVHENINAQHRVGQAKFLERAAADSQDEVRELVRRALQKGLPTQ